MDHAETVSAQQFFKISHASRSIFSLLLRRLAEGSRHELALNILDRQHTVFDRVFHDQPPDGSLPLLAQAVHPVDSLVLDRRRPPAIGKDGLVGGDEVQPDGAHAETGEEHGALGVAREAVGGVVAGDGVHFAVDAGEADADAVEMRLEQVEERGPLAEDDGLGAGRLALGGEDLDEGLDLAAGVVWVSGGNDGVVVGGLAELDGGRDQRRGVGDVGATQRASVLALDDLLDAVAVEGVRAGGDDGLLQGVEADGAHFLVLDADLQHVLEGFDVLRGERDHFVLLEEGGQVVDAVLAQGPVVADLAETEDDFEEVRVGCVGFVLRLVFLEHAAGFRPVECVSGG